MIKLITKKANVSTEPETNYIPVYEGNARYRDEYGKYIPIITKKYYKKLIKRDSTFKLIGDTDFNKAGHKNGIIINGIRYRVKRKNPLKKCIGYIVCENKSIIRIVKSVEWPKTCISALLIAAIGFTGFTYLNSDGTWDMMLNKATSKSDFRDNFNYSDQVVSSESSIEISNNTYNPVTLQYILYSDGVKIYDTGILEPGESADLLYQVYFDSGTYNLTCETIAKSLDGLSVVSNNSQEFKLTVR